MTVHAGWCGFELVGNAFKITSEIADIDDLEKVLSSRFLRFSLDSQSAESPFQQQVSVVRQHSQQRSVMEKAEWCSLKVLLCGFVLWVCCEAIKKEAELAIPTLQADIYIQQEASPFCVANDVASQNATRHWNRIVLF